MPHVDEGTLHAYLDGELPSPSVERQTLEAHLAECASCRSMLADEQALRERASALLGVTRPMERAAPPFEQLRPPSPKRSPWRVRTPLAWAASIALALGMGYYLHEPAAPTRLADRTQPVEESKSTRAPARPSGQRKDRTPAPAVIPEVATRTGAADAGAVAADEAATVARHADSASDRLARLQEAVIAPPAATAQPHNAAAAPAARQDSQTLSALTASGVSSQVTELRGRTTTTSWPIISRGTARSLLGADPVGLPGLARKIRRSPANDGTVVVEQQIDPATTIQIFQRPNAGVALEYDSVVKAEQRQAFKTSVATPDRLARYVGRLRVEIAGPISTDSLNKLLDQVQPLP